MRQVPQPSAAKTSTIRSFLNKIFLWPWVDLYMILKVEKNWYVIDMTIFAPDYKSINWDESNEPKIIQIGQIEAEIFAISIFGSESKDLYRKNVFRVFF